MHWVELSVEVDEEAVENVSELLRGFGSGVAIDVPFLQLQLDDDPTHASDRKALVKTYVPDDPNLDVACLRLEQALWHLSQMRQVGPLLMRRIAEEDWANSWKPFFPVLHIGERIVIVPAWRRYRRRAEDVVVRLDPGLAFGTGTHPTTRLCLELMEPRVSPGSAVLDVGTGSGILAIAAARLGASPVVAVEIDPQAVGSARANVKLNRLSRVVRIREGSLDADPTLVGNRPFDLILANLTARINQRLAASMAARLAAKGTLIASGILAEHETAVAATFAEHGLQVNERRLETDWVALVVGRKA